MQVTLVTRISSQMILVTFITAPYFKIRSPDRAERGGGTLLEEEGKRGEAGQPEQVAVRDRASAALRLHAATRRSFSCLWQGRVQEWGWGWDIRGCGDALGERHVMSHTHKHTHRHTLVPIPIPQSMPP